METLRDGPKGPLDQKDFRPTQVDYKPIDLDYKLLVERVFKNVASPS